MSRPRLLDLFCGAGGAGMGYWHAGFDVLGVDKNPQPRYPFPLVQADAMTYPLNGFAAIHASPPCKAHSQLTHFHPGVRETHEDLVGPTRERLDRVGAPYVIENVMGAPLRKDLVLCGEMFGLRVHRHRIFETSGFFAMQPRHAPHVLKGALHNCHVEDGHARQVAGNFADLEDAREAMGIDWMARSELSQAIPPAYTEHIGHYLLNAVNARAAA